MPDIYLIQPMTLMLGGFCVFGLGFIVGAIYARISIGLSALIARR